MLKPIFSRDILSVWLITNQGSEDQRARYREMVALYDALGVNTPEELEEKLQQQEKPEPEQAAMSGQLDLVFPGAGILQPDPVVVDDVIQPAKLRCLLFFAADDRGLGRSFLLYELAKSIDTSGSSIVPVQQLREVAFRFRVSRRSFYRWLAGAKSAGFMREICRRVGGKVLILASRERVAWSVRCNRVDARPVILSWSDLLGDDCTARARIYAAFQLVTFSRPNGKIYRVNGKPQITRSPVSRAALREITGIPKNTQIRYERSMGVKVNAAYSLSELDSDKLDGAKEVLNRSHAFVSEYTGRVAWRLPNNYYIREDLAGRGKRGRSRKINDYLNHNMWTDSSEPGCVVLCRDVQRRYFKDREAAFKSLRRREDLTNDWVYGKLPRWRPRSGPSPWTGTSLYSPIWAGV